MAPSAVQPLIPAGPGRGTTARESAFHPSMEPSSIRPGITAGRRAGSRQSASAAVMFRAIDAGEPAIDTVIARSSGVGRSSAAYWLARSDAGM